MPKQLIKRTNSDVVLMMLFVISLAVILMVL